MLQDRCPVCNVDVLWPNDWMDQDATWYGGRPRPRRHCVRWGPNSSPRKGAQQPPHTFGPTLLWHDRLSEPVSFTHFLQHVISQLLHDLEPLQNFPGFLPVVVISVYCAEAAVHSQHNTNNITICASVFASSKTFGHVTQIDHVTAGTRHRREPG